MVTHQALINLVMAVCLLSVSDRCSAYTAAAHSAVPSVMPTLLYIISIVLREATLN
jgi:hypothetical protein